MLAPSDDTNSQVVIRGTYALFDKILGHNTYIYSEFNDKNRKLIVELGHEAPSNYALENLIAVIYGYGVIPNTIGSYVNSDTIAVFSNLSPRGWDTSAPPETGHKFTCKPDGQNMWLLWIGNIWYKFSPRCKGGIRAWTWSNSASDRIVVLSVEDMASYGYVVIDCFTNESGDIANSSRDINWVINTARTIARVNPKLPLIIREYFDDYSSVIEYNKRLLYPIDGVVAIRNGSTEILKIKPIKSIELALAEDGKLTTSDGTVVIQCPAHIASLYELHSILEVRFEVSNSNSIKVLDIFSRVDKTNANSDSAVSNVIRSAYKVLTPEDNERRAALLWCNSLRKNLHMLALERTSSNSIVVDIGTGTGQSLDSIPQLESISYVFIEPDASRCKSIARRLGTRKILNAPTDIIPMIKSLKTRAVRSLIMNCTVSDILQHDKVSDVLFSETRAIMCTFSMHFVVNELHYIASNYGIPVYGCAYVYDGMNNDGILVNEHGVVMRQEDHDTATVKWGGDKCYSEPMTLRRDYAGIGHVVPGFEITGAPDRTVASGAFDICKHVMVVTP
ncbi:hypothetical protein CDD83_4376 [Cordyceps sp. RAO-2017]|nr:hypothetical protein CDD83_4376 [Cordyceps sp. RAO-2017]